MSAALLKKNFILFDVNEQDKSNILAQMIRPLVAEGRIRDADLFLQDVLDRESLSPTAMGHLLAIPHGRTENVLVPSLAIARLTNEMQWSEGSDEPVQFVILIAVPGDDEDNTHLRILSQLARNLMHESFRNELLNGTQEEVFNKINEIIEEK